MNKLEFRLMQIDPPPLLFSSQEASKVGQPHSTCHPPAPYMGLKGGSTEAPNDPPASLQRGRPPPASSPSPTGLHLPANSGLRVNIIPQANTTTP